jgi:hypothetical protein
VAFNRLAANRIDGAMLASMAVTSGAVYVRSDQHRYRIGT